MTMIGFLIGAACLIGLVKVLRAGRGWGWRRGAFGRGACGGGWSGYGGSGSCGSGWRGHHGHHGHDSYGERHGGSWGPRIFLRSLFERLDTSPGQEKVILSAVEDLFSKRRALREELEKSRADAARAVSGVVFDDTAMGAAFTRQDALLAELRDALSSSLKAIHEALDERQRKTLGDLIERGFFRGGWGHHDHEDRHGGPYRSTWA
jgi:hypothetical protein